MAAITLRALIAAHPDLFYPQTWYEDEPFMDVAIDAVPRPPVWSCEYPVAPEGDGLVPAAELAAAYVRYPDHEIWRDYLWTADTDRQGQRVYVGGTANGKGFEIHRHLHLTERWGIPVW